MCMRVYCFLAQAIFCLFQNNTCYMCNGFYAQNHGEAICSICHAFLFPHFAQDLPVKSLDVIFVIIPIAKCLMVWFFRRILIVILVMMNHKIYNCCCIQQSSCGGIEEGLLTLTLSKQPQWLFTKIREIWHVVLQFQVLPIWKLYLQKVALFVILHTN